MKPGILIVDDSLTVRMDLQSAFELAGFETALCATALAARDALARTAFSLVVLDVLLPDGDGIELLKEIKGSNNTSQIPVMLLSTEAEVKDRVRGLKTGADEYVGKPYDTAHVIARSRELIQQVKLGSGSANATSILVIDDSLTFRETLKSALQAAGYDVTAAGSGEDGLRAAVALRPAAIIVDGVMTGIDGATVIRRIRSDVALRRTPCLLLTASEDRANEVRALDAGADAYVRKEDDIGIVLARLSAVLRSADTPDAISATPSLFGPKKVLAVDDSLTYLQSLAEQLRDEGYDVIQARSGRDALELLSVQPVDCILLDLIMPDLSGQETCRQIKSSPVWRDIPLIMLTALEENEAMVAGINAGADDYISKSGEFEILKARLRAQLRRKQFEDENRSIREQLLKKEIEATEARATQKLADTRALLLADLEKKNEELEAFSYSVSHDLRAPLRAIDGFSRNVLERCAPNLDEQGKAYLQRVCAAAKRMSEMIDALLELSRVTRHEMKCVPLNLTALFRTVAKEFGQVEPERNIELVIAEGLEAEGDPSLMRMVIENILGNAWKYTRKRTHPKIECGAAETDGKTVYFVRDNGAGFDMAYGNKLFGTFQRLHSVKDFEGTGVGLATVKRIISRHGGEIWAEGIPEQGATFHFTLPRRSLQHSEPAE